MVNSSASYEGDGNATQVQTSCKSTSNSDLPSGTQTTEVFEEKDFKGGSLYCSLPLDKILPLDEMQGTPEKAQEVFRIQSLKLPEKILKAHKEKMQKEAPKQPEKTQGPQKPAKPPKGRKLLCLYCERSFVSPNLRQKHVERVHSTNPSALQNSRRLSARRQNQVTATSCGYCDKLNDSEKTLKDLFLHLVNEHSNKYYACLPCEDRFANRSALAEHNATKHQTQVFLEQDQDPSADSRVPSPQIEEAQPVKLTRSRVKHKNEEDSFEENKQTLIKKKTVKLKELKSKKLSVKSSRIALQRRESKRLQNLAKAPEKKKKRSKPAEKKQTSIVENSTKSTEKGVKSSTACVNPYPEFDSFYRVKKITDHSIDNLKISSLTFDDVFDKAFFNRIKCNIEENLLHHIDGKLFENEESENRISNFEKISNISQENQTSSTENYGCDISLNAVTPVASLSLNSQFGEDFESQIEYGSKPSKKKAQIRKDEVHYKYFTRRKFQASILEHKENRDLSRLDMWTQLVIKKRQQKMLDQKKTAKEMLEYTTGNEYRSKMKREELNRILDRRGPFEDLKEEASKKAAQDKLSSPHKTDLNHESYVEVREVLYEILNKVFETCEKSTAQVSKREDLREIPSYLNLRSASLPGDEIDESDRITLICSSQETENFELPTNQIRGKDEVIELSGEWARCRMYICAACGAKLPNMKYLMEHKNIYHQNVWVQHYEFVGNQSELYRHLSIPCLGKIGAVEVSVPCKTWKRSEARLCTKCGKQCNSLGELHRHVLECGGDWTWMLARKKCKYRPFGAKSRRKRRGLVHRVHVKRKTEPKEKKNYKKTFDGPRQRPSDAETIQRMLANLPAKRSTRKLISLQDGIYRSRKKKVETQVNKTKIKCGKVIYKSRNIKENPEKTININTNSTTRRTLRNIGKVLSSKIIDSNSSLAVRRKLRAINERRRTKQLQEANEEEIEEDTKEVEKLDDIQKENEEVATRTSPRLLRKMSMKKILTGKVNIKTFFPVKKSKNSVPDSAKKDENKITRSKRRSNETENNIEELTPENVKGKKPEPKKTKDECLVKVASKTSTPKKKKASGETEKPLEAEILEMNHKKRKVKQHFKIAMEKVKKLKIDREISQKKQVAADSFLGRNKQNDKLDPRITPHSYQEKIAVNPQPEKETVINLGEITNINSQKDLLIGTEKIATQEKSVENQKILSGNLVINPQEKKAINLLAQELPHENTIVSSEKTHSQPEKIVITSSTVETEENTADISETVPIVMKFNENEENHQVPETIFKLESNNEKSLQAKGELNFDSKPNEKEKTQPITIETSLKQKTPPLVSPNVKGKIRKPSRGLNDCIAMLTNKLQQKAKDDNTDGALDLSSSAVVKPRSDCILKIPTFKTQQVSALDLSMKSKPKFDDLQCFLENKPVNIFYKEKLLKDSKPKKFSRKVDPLDQTIEDAVVDRILQIPKFYNSWSSVDETIQNVIDNHHETPTHSWNTVDDIIEFVVANTNTDYHNQTVKLFKKSKINFIEDHSIFEPKVIITESDEQICSVNKLELIEDIICQKRAEVLNRPKRGRPKKGNDERRTEVAKAEIEVAKEAANVQDDDVPVEKQTNENVEQIGAQAEQICKEAEEKNEKQGQTNEGVAPTNKEMEQTNGEVEQVDVPTIVDSLGASEDPMVPLQECSEKCSDSEDEIPLATLMIGVKLTHDELNVAEVKTNSLQSIESSALENTVTNLDLPETNTPDVNLEISENPSENIPEILKRTKEISQPDEPCPEKPPETTENLSEALVVQVNDNDFINKITEDVLEEKKEEINLDQTPDTSFNSSILLEDSSAVFKAPLQKKTKRKSKRMRASEKTKHFCKNKKPITENVMEPINDEKTQVATEKTEESIETLPIPNSFTEITASNEEISLPNDISEPHTVSITEESNSESSVPDSSLEIIKKKSKRKTAVKKRVATKLDLKRTEINASNSDSSDALPPSNDELTANIDITTPSRIPDFNIRDVSVTLSKDKFIDSLKQGEFLCVNEDEIDGKLPTFLKICLPSDVSELSDSSKSSDFPDDQRIRRHSLRSSKCDEFSGSENSVDSLSSERSKGTRKNSRTSLTESISLENDKWKTPRLKSSIEESEDKVSTRNKKKGLDNSLVGEKPFEFLENVEKTSVAMEENKKITRSFSRNNSSSDASESSQPEGLIGEEKRRKSVRISGKTSFPTNLEESTFDISESDTSVAAPCEPIKEPEIEPMLPKVDPCDQEFRLEPNVGQTSENETDKIESDNAAMNELSVIIPLSFKKKKIYKGKKKKKKPGSIFSHGETFNGMPEQSPSIEPSLEKSEDPVKIFGSKMHVKVPVNFKKQIKVHRQKNKICEKDESESSKLVNEDIPELPSNLEEDKVEASHTFEEITPHQELVVGPEVENPLCSPPDANTEKETNKKKKCKNNSKSAEDLICVDIHELLNTRKPRSTRNNKISYVETEDNDTDDKNEQEEDVTTSEEVEANSAVPSEDLQELADKNYEEDLAEALSPKCSWDKSTFSPDQSENTENVAKNNFPENSTEEEVAVARKEPPIKLIINTQKTRRKSKSLKKGNFKGELFKDFALVIKKPKRSAHVIAYSNSEVFIKDLKTTDLNFLEENPKHNGDIDVSMEEMDMEIDDIPFTSSIIERSDLTVIANNQNSNSEDDVKVQKKSKTKQLCKRKFKGSKNRRIHKTRIKKLDQILKENNKINEIIYQTDSPAIVDESTNVSEKIGAEDIEANDANIESQPDLPIIENEEAEVVPNPGDTEDQPPVDYDDDNNLPEAAVLGDNVQKDIDNIYNFDETDDLDEPVEIPLKRFSRKQLLSRFESGTAADLEKKLPETDDVDPVIPAEPTPKKKTNKPRDETNFVEDLDQVKKRNKPRDELSLLEIPESFSRKSVRSAKVKALESIHDEALAELTEDEQETDSKKSKKSQKVNAVVKDFEFSKKILVDERSPSFADLVADLEGLEELENSIERELNAEPNEKQSNESKEETEENHELRRSRRGSRKVTSYNENDLIDPILDILDDKKKSKKKDEKAPPKKEKLNTEQLFDMIKSSAVEPPQNTFLQNFDSFSSEMNPNESFNSVFNKIIENAEETTKKISKKHVSLTEESSESNVLSDEVKSVKSDSNYCEICNKSFIRTDNLLKHKRTITHIQRLSEIEAKEAEEKSKKMQEKKDFPELPESDINIKNILLESERPGINSPIVHSSFTNNDSLKLADIISDVLNKPVLQENDDNKFCSKRYKSLGERKSFDSDNIIIPNPISDSYISKTTILEKQISLLQNMIENQTGVNYIDDISMSSNSSENNKNQKKDDSFLKPTQYEEISEDSINLRNYEDQKLRKTLNRDEELFLECCSLLKSGSEVSTYSNQKVSNNLEMKKYDDELKSAEEKKQEDLYELDEEFSDDNNSRIPTPLGDSYDDDASNSNTISSNWDMNKMAPVFAENEPNNSNLTFEKVLGDTIQHDEHEDTDIVDRKSSEEPEQTPKEDIRKMITKGARKVFEGLKVSIPTEELNLEELNLNRPPSETAPELKPEKPIRTGRKSKPVKKSQVGSNLLFKMNKKTLQVSSFSKEDGKSFDVYDFEETQDNTEVFTKPDYRTFRNKKSSEVESESEDYFDSLVMEPSESTDSSIISVKKPKSHESITKKKCMIMGRIFKNQARSKLEGIDEEMRDIPVIDNDELVENYVANCKKIIKNEMKPKLSETEINQLFDQLLEGKNTEQPNAESTNMKIVPKPKKAPEYKKKKLKHRKRVRNNSESTDDEFNINKISKRKNGKSEDNCINLEQELKECIGVASRKSQRKCTSGKQNVLVEYWSSDDSQFEALLETQKIEVKTKETVIEKEKSIIDMPEITEKNLTRKPPRPKKIQQRKKSASERKSLTETPEVHKKRKSLSENPEGINDLKKKKTISESVPENLDNDLILTNRRKRAAVNPLYHWSSSSEDESQDLIEIKPLRDELEDEEDRPIQHGWIVGDSPKKLVTMLAQAKGKKIDVDCVKEQKKRTNANSVS